MVIMRSVLLYSMGIFIKQTFSWVQVESNKFKVAKFYEILQDLVCLYNPKLILSWFDTGQTKLKIDKCFFCLSGR